MAALLARARSAVAARRYSDAIAAYDAAEAVMDLRADAQILAERGYARLLAGDGPGALRELTEASDIPSDAPLLGQIWFNIGLTHQALLNGSDAILAFHRSNRIHATPQAIEKLAGKKVCPLAVDPTRVEARSFRDWSEWSKHVDAAPYYSGVIPSEAAAHAVGGGPWVVEIGAHESGFGLWAKLVLARIGGRLFDFGRFGYGEAGPASGETCGMADTVDLATLGDRVIVHIHTVAVTKMPVTLDGHQHATATWAKDDASCTRDDSCLRTCMEYRETDRYVVLDMVHPARTLTLAQENDFAAVYDQNSRRPPLEITVTPGETEFAISGADCRNIQYPP